MSYRNENYVQADYGKYSICKNLDEIHFDDVYAMRRILGDDSKVLEGKSFLWYCTDEGKEALVDEQAGVVDFEVRPELEALMDKVQDYIDRQADPYYGVPDEEKLSRAIKDVQAQLRFRLRVTDQFLLIDSVMSPEQQAQLITWRQACRDTVSSVTNFDDAIAVKFPEAPEELVEVITAEEPYFEATLDRIGNINV